LAPVVAICSRTTAAPVTGDSTSHVDVLGRRDPRVSELVRRHPRRRTGLVHQRGDGRGTPTGGPCRRCRSPTHQPLAG
jgi:hypothetical protein